MTAKASRKTSSSHQQKGPTMLTWDVHNLTGGSLDTNQMRWLFPKAISCQYNLTMTGLYCYEMDTSARTVDASGPRFSSRYDDQPTEVEDRQRMAGVLHHLLHQRLGVRSPAVTDADHLALALMDASMLFQTIEASKGYPWTIDVEDLELEEFGRDDIAHKFTDQVVHWSVNSDISSASFLPQVSAFLSLRPFDEGARYYWVDRISCAFIDFGIVMRAAKGHQLVYLQFLNDQ